VADGTKERLASSSPHKDEHEPADLPTADLLLLERDLAAGAPEREDAPARAARLEADQRLVNRLRQDGFAGPLYERAAAGLMDYSWRTISKWISTGEIFARSAYAGRPIPENKRTTTWSLDDRCEIATDTVIDGLCLFREHGLVRGKWTPLGGASLTTYSVGAALRSFRPVYSRWHRSRRQRHAEMVSITGRDGPDDPLMEIPDQKATDPYQAAATYDEAIRIMRRIDDPQVRQGLLLRAQGYTQREAAAHLGLTEKALERKTSRARTKIARNSARQPGGEGGTR
jgi:DNA-directed RNA polymerase specialized sigma24 family protein